MPAQVDVDNLAEEAHVTCTQTRKQASLVTLQIRLLFLHMVLTPTSGGCQKQTVASVLQYEMASGMMPEDIELQMKTVLEVMQDKGMNRYRDVCVKVRHS